MRKLASTNTRNKSHLETTCGMAYTISVIGGRWKLSILGLLFDFGDLRFNELQSRLNGISDKMLTTQLKDLEGEGLIKRSVFVQAPIRVEYSLTEKGQSLGPVLTAMSEWGSAHINGKVLADIDNT